MNRFGRWLWERRRRRAEYWLFVLGGLNGITSPEAKAWEALADDSHVLPKDWSGKRGSTHE